MCWVTASKGTAAEQTSILWVLLMWPLDVGQSVKALLWPNSLFWVSTVQFE